MEAKMNIKSLTGSVSLFLAVVSYNTSAALVSMDLNTPGDGLITLDESTGLEWLDLSVTAGQDYVDAETLNPGWRYATNAEVETIFPILFDGYYDTWPSGMSRETQGAYVDQRTDVNSFIDLFGIVWTNSTDEASTGLYMDEDNILRMMGAQYRFDPTDTDSFIFGLEYTNVYSTTSNFLEGIYLVRDTVVPVPAAVWLFGSGLLGLIGVARRKKS